MSGGIFLAGEANVNYDRGVDLIGVTQVAELLGMTRAGAHKLVGRETSFPSPVSVVGNRKLWRREDVEAWIATRPLSLDQAKAMDGDRPRKAAKPVVRPHGAGGASLRPTRWPDA